MIYWIKWQTREGADNAPEGIDLHKKLLSGRALDLGPGVSSQYIPPGVLTCLIIPIA